MHYTANNQSGSGRMNGAFEISTICGWPFSLKTNSPGSGNALSVSLGRVLRYKGRVVPFAESKGRMLLAG